MATDQDTPPSQSSLDLQRGVQSGLKWVGLASSMVSILDILAFVLIMRFWLTPAETGVGAYAFVLFPILDLATDLGLVSAVIQRDDHSKEKISTVFWLNVGMSGILFALLTLVIGPFLDWFHGESILTGLLTAYGFKLIWQNIYFMPYALMKREMRFKELSVIRIIANFAEFAGKIGFAAAGFGVWCFVAGPLCRVVITAIGVQLRNPWRPSFVFHFSEGWDWAKYGFKTSGHKILFYLYTALDTHVVGWFISDAAAGIYVIAYRIALEPALVISEVTVNVAFPTFAKLKHHKDRLFEQLVSFSRTNLVVMLAFVGTVFLCAEEILGVFSSYKGADYSVGATSVRLLSGVAVLRALSFVIPPFLDGIGRPMLTLVYSIFASVIMSAMFVSFAYFFGASLGFDSVALAWLVGYPIAFVILIWIALAVLDTSAWSLFRRLWGIVACGIVAIAVGGAGKYLVLDQPAIVRFAVPAVLMLVCYFALLARYEGIDLRTIAQSKKSS